MTACSNAAKAYDFEFRLQELSSHFQDDQGLIHPREIKRDAVLELAVGDEEPSVAKALFHLQYVANRQRQLGHRLQGIAGGAQVSRHPWLPSGYQDAEKH